MRWKLSRSLNYGVKKKILKIRAMYTNYIKRFFDISISFIMLIILFPILLIITILLYLCNDGAGAFFFQNRPGKNGKIFKIIKFKTMNDCRDQNGNLLPDVSRITKIGNFVRRTSLDEIPQLINVLKGDMSLIGPRPLLVQYLPLYSKRQARRHEVRPGITGWAQVNGRNSLSWGERFELDVWYVDNISFRTDIKIIYLTIIKVLRRDSINNLSNQKVTMQNFDGNN